MRIISTKEIGASALNRFFLSRWGSPRIVSVSGVYYGAELDGFLALNEEGAIVGLCTYVMYGEDCEVITIDSVEENQGIGTALLRRAEQEACANGCRCMRLITTNDNLHALGFYQKRGYRLVEVFPYAVDRARAIKPEIPLVADNGIPIRDEILLRKDIHEEETEP
ncbi:GNAT family N-acetyltransferase [Paenibacillus lycopersici]|uniref:GNAT family N-acetyltransferase n=1 Tax=Paenibacillus lycopersici TaxID=2704462 RepID=A0A6C0G3S4_9BACL|nr:GNAT family N-acetyltransferase [Paenibacillus lycopersici]QHT63182.1 GNAT family N-acetyltransferase [Paenibacillus lycopersici]